MREAPGDFTPGSYLRRAPEQYDRTLCLIPEDVLDFVYATQPKEWEKLKKQHGADAKPTGCSSGWPRRSSKHGTLDVLRKGDQGLDGCKFQLAYFRPASGLNEAIAEALRRPTCSPSVRQLQYSEKNENSLDLVALPERPADLHRGTEEPADRPERRERHPPVPLRPRPEGAAVRLRPLPGPFRRRS